VVPKSLGGRGEFDEVIELTSLRTRKLDDIVSAVSKATHIAAQTAFVQGSDDQLMMFVRLMSKMPSKEIFINYHPLRSYLERHLTDEQFHSIKHHNVHDMGYDFEHSELLKFDEQVGRHQAELDYMLNAKDRPTGAKVRILACYAGGPQFKGLSIGSVVDVIDFSKQDPNPSRGVWVWGNGEPVKLINDLPQGDEYEIVSDVGEPSVVDKIMSITSTHLDYFNEGGQPDKDMAEILLAEYRQFLTEMVERLKAGKDTAMGIATTVCDYLGIERRMNRKRIYDILK